MAPRKLLLDATSRAPSAFSEFTKNYRSSSNVEDRRNTQKEMRDSRTPRAGFGDLASMRSDASGSTGRGRDTGYTPDDYSGGAADAGVAAAQTTRQQWPGATTSLQSEINYQAGQARKVDAAEALDITGNRR